VTPNKRGSATTMGRPGRRIALAIATCVVAAPWVLGLVYNTFHAWRDPVFYWGRFYGRSDVGVSQSEQGMAMPLLGLVAGATALPKPTVALDFEQAPTVLVVRLPSGGYAVYELHGGP
jgi:hypothetical protein